MITGIGHIAITCKDIDTSLDFYTRILGMKVLRQNEYPDGRFTNTFVGYQGEDDGTTIEMTYNWDQEEPYDMGNACLGFINGMASVGMMIDTGLVDYGLIVDGENSREVVELLLELQQEFNTTLLLATHSSAISDRADRVLSLHDGRLRPGDRHLPAHPGQGWHRVRP